MPRTTVFLPILISLILPCALAGQERAAPGVRVEWPGDTFRDAGARELVLHALALRDSAAAGLDSYEATATERMHIGFQVTRRLPLRARTLYHREQVARVYWQRNGDNRVRWLGRREGKPTMGDDWSERAPFGLDFDIAEELDLDDIGIDMLFDPRGDRMDVFDGEFVQPVSARGLRLYRFSSGDTMHIRLPSPERSITLVEVVVLPREKDWETVEGSLWFDLDSGVLVRAGFRPSDVWDMAVREPHDLDDVPGFLQPAVGTVTSIVIEYGLYEQRWWLPRRVLADGALDWGRGLVRMPLIIEWTMTGHAVNEAPGPAVVPGPGLVTVGWNRSDGNGRLEQTQYMAERGVDLARSPDLPPPVADVALLAFTRAELAPLVRRIEQVAGPPPRGRAPALLPSVLQSLRYDRVRGPSAGLEWAGDAGRFRLSVQGRFASAVPEPFAEAGAARGAFTATIYHRLADASDWNVADGLGNTMATLLFGHDGGDYYRATGFSLARSSADERGRVHVEAFVEDHRPIARQASVSLATVGGGSLRPNLSADAVTVAGARISLAGQLGSNPRRAVLNGRLWAEAATGDADFTRVAASARLTTTPFDRLAFATELAAGIASRGAPVQREFLLGGASSLRGVVENALAGSSFWLGRAEIGTPLQGARALLFIDVGWAGARAGFARSQPSAGTGLGASFMDGLFRFDIARGIVRSDAWRVYFYLDALL